ncbi:MAG: SufS family cysteine desulfurase [Pirellulaceae bacterium]|nr:SufS family cysteine desulfurase [Planctomycetales bacterium]
MTDIALDPQLVRADFPILSRVMTKGRPLVFLDNAASTQRPVSVIEAMDRVYRNAYANVHRGAHTLSEECSDLYEQARHTVARFINASHVEEVVFTSGTTMSINLVAHAWGEERLRADDEILVTQMEHHANLVPWFQLAERTNAKVRFLPIEADGTLSLDRLRAMLSERTRLIAFAAVSNVLGTRNDVAQIVRIAREAGVATLVDAAQHVPHDPTDVQAWGADFVAFSGHKMLGPTGVGVLWGRRELLDSIQPFLGGGNMIEEVTEQGFTTKASPARFEAGTPPIVEVIGLAAAVDYLSRWPMEAIARHEHRLTEVAMAGMSRIDGLRILGPAPDQRAGIVSFVVDGVSPHDLCKFLDLRGFALRDGHHCAMPLHRSLGIDHSARASFYLYNTVEEVERFVETLAATIEKLR